MNYLNFIEHIYSYLTTKPLFNQSLQIFHIKILLQCSYFHLRTIVVSSCPVKVKNILLESYRHLVSQQTISSNILVLSCLSILFQIWTVWVPT